MSTQEVIDDFVKKVMWLHEPEYGDFKRRLGLYLNRLEKTLPTHKKVINEARKFILYECRGDVDQARLRTIETIQGFKVP